MRGMGRKAISPLEIYRRRHGMRQYDLARAAGVSTSYISELESGSRTGRVEVWKKLAGALNTGLDDLLASEAKLSGIDRPLIALTKSLSLYDRVLESPPDRSPARPSGEIQVMAHLWGPDRYVVRCHDQTMFPTLHEGDLVLVEARDKIPLRRASGRICVVLHEGKAALRKVRVSRRPPLGPKSPSLDPASRPEDFEVRGKVSGSEGRDEGRPEGPRSEGSQGGTRIVLEADNPLVPPVEVKPEDGFKVCGICISIVERDLQG